MRQLTMLMCASQGNGGGGFQLPFNLQSTNNGGSSNQQPSPPSTNPLATLANNLNFLQNTAPAPAAAVPSAGTASGWSMASTPQPGGVGEGQGPLFADASSLDGGPQRAAFSTSHCLAACWSSSGVANCRCGQPFSALAPSCANSRCGFRTRSSTGFFQSPASTRAYLERISNHKSGAGTHDQNCHAGHRRDGNEEIGDPH